MCKFHILGMCSKGDQCAYAHSKEQMCPLPDLSRTKICKTLINKGQCTDPNCRFAHNRNELRTSAVFNGVKLCKLRVDNNSEQQADLGTIPSTATNAAAVVGMTAPAQLLNKANFWNSEQGPYSMTIPAANVYAPGEDWAPGTPGMWMQQLQQMQQLQNAYQFATNDGMARAGAATAAAYQKEEVQEAERGAGPASCTTPPAMQHAAVYAGEVHMQQNPGLIMPSQLPQDMFKEWVNDRRVVVKNTFLDFEASEAPVKGMRTVHTAAGRLDLLDPEPSEL